MRALLRTSVDHGTAFDIAYKDGNPSTLSYVNAVKEAVKLATGKAITHLLIQVILRREM